MKTLKDFLNLLFDPDELTCFTESPTGTNVRYDAWDRDLFFCINPLHPEKDLNPTLEYHSADRPRRADHNVIHYRNFLIELDSMPLDEQIDYVTSKIPVSSVVYSGGKSYHFIISLVDPLPSKAEYDKLFKRLQLLLPKIDKACKNPSRLSRLPFRMRPDTKNEQRLVALLDRISYKDLTVLLPEVSEAKVYSMPQTETERDFVAVEIMDAMQKPEEAIRNIGLSGRNQFFFWLGCRLKELDYGDTVSYNTVIRAYENLSNKDNFSIQEALSAARITN